MMAVSTGAGKPALPLWALPLAKDASKAPEFAPERLYKALDKRTFFVSAEDRWLFPPDFSSAGLSSNRFDGDKG